MRNRLSFLLILICLALILCVILSVRSRRPNHKNVAQLTGSLIFPVIGNIIITISGDRTLATIGYYIYFLGMDLVMWSLLRFTFSYCKINWPDKRLPWLIYSVIMIDVFQYFLNPFLGQAFSTEAVMVDGYPYYKVIAHAGQTFHRLLDYAIFFSVLVIFLIRVIFSSRYDSERYSVILIVMALTGILQTYYIFSRTPIDRSMVGYAIFGILVFYFSLYYRPLRLLDRMLVNVVSDLPEALYFFDAGGSCIWANSSGSRLVGIKGDNYGHVNEKLRQMFGKVSYDKVFGPKQFSTGSGESVRSYILENRMVTDSKKRIAGSFLRVRDNTAEHHALQKETYNATHDILTGAYNRTGYYAQIIDVDLPEACMVLIDLDSFKKINDTYGHKAGDKVLLRTVQCIQRYFRKEDTIYRIGGDEFVVLMLHIKPGEGSMISERIRLINQELMKDQDGIPRASVSAGIAFGLDASSKTELFEHADEALYHTKQTGKRGCTFWKK